jgi:hypothetical protein
MKIDEKIVVYFGERTAKFLGGRWVISLPHEFFDTVRDKIREGKTTKEVTFKIYVTENQKIVLEVV